MSPKLRHVYSERFRRLVVTHRHGAVCGPSLCRCRCWAARCRGCGVRDDGPTVARQEARRLSGVEAWCRVEWPRWPAVQTAAATEAVALRLTPRMADLASAAEAR